MKDLNATVIVDLKPSLEDVFLNLHKDARWGVKKAEKEGLVIEESEDWEGFYPIYEETIKLGGATPQSKETLEKNTDRLFLCKKEGKIIAGAGIWFVNIYNKEIPRLYFNASIKDYQSLQPNNILYWACISWAKNQGYEEFDLGGWQINAEGHLVGVNKYKERWGKVKYFKKDYPLHKAIGRKLVRNFKVLRWANQKARGRK